MSIKRRRGGAIAQSRRKSAEDTEFLARFGRRSAQRHGHAHIDAFGRLRSRPNQEETFVLQHGFNVLAARYQAEEGAFATVDYRRQFPIVPSTGTYERERLGDLPQAWDRINSRNDCSVRCGNYLRRPLKPSDWIIDQQQVITPCDHAKEGIQRMNVEMLRSVFHRGAAKMSTPLPWRVLNQLKKMFIKSLWGVRQFRDLQTWFAVEIIAKMTGLEIEVHQTDIAVAYRLIGLISAAVSTIIVAFPTPPALGMKRW